MPFGTINGTGSRIFCRGVRGTLAQRPKTIGCLWKRFFIVIARAFPGETCRNVFGDPIKIHTRFSRWAKSGVWKKIFAMLAADADNEYAMIDRTIVPPHQHT